MSLIEGLDMFYIEHVPRETNEMANGLAQQASGYEVTRGRFAVQMRSVWRQQMSVYAEDCEPALIADEDVKPGDWRYAIQECVKYPSNTRDKKIR
jgi:hypothetical protein